MAGDDQKRRRRDEKKQRWGIVIGMTGICDERHGSDGDDRAQRNIAEGEQDDSENDKSDQHDFGNDGEKAADTAGHAFAAAKFEPYGKDVPGNRAEGSE